jgi:hypothetical protein
VLLDGKFLKLHLSVGCKLTAPCVDASRGVERLASVAARHLARGAGEGLRRRLGEEVGRAAAVLAPGLGKEARKLRVRLPKKIFNGF